MGVRARLQRLERHGPPGGAAGRAPPVGDWLPENGRDGRPPGHSPCPGSNAVLVIHQPEEPPPGEAAARQAVAGSCSHGTPPGPITLVEIDEAGHALSVAVRCVPDRFDASVDVTDAQPWPTPFHSSSSCQSSSVVR